MRSISHLSLRALALAGLVVSGLATARAEDKLFDLSGFLDLYYAYDFGRPGAGATVNLRQYDVYHNSFRLALASISLVRKPTELNPLGFTADVLAGRSTDIIHLSEPGGQDLYKDFGQVFISYRVPGALPLTLDFGKFYTSIGAESLDTRTTDLYSRSFTYTLAQPIYHTGIRATAGLTPEVTGTLAAVQGWNEVEDSNKQKSFLGTLAFAPEGPLTGAVSFYFGREGATGTDGIGFPSEQDTTLLDIVANYQMDEALKVGLNVTFGDARGLGKWSGVAVTGRQVIDETWSGAVRFEQVDDQDGLRTGVSSKLSSLTAGVDYTFDKNLLLRLEIRTDFSDVALFNSNAGLKKDRTTFTFAQIIRF